MEIKELKPGLKLELDLLDGEDGNNFRKLASKLQIVSDNELLIDAPISGTMIYPVHIGSAVDVFFSRKTDRQIDIFKFRARVVGREYMQNLALLRISPEGRIQMIQRRQYFRLECSLPLRYRQVVSLNPEYNREIKYKNTISRNLSGGGLCICVEERVNIGETVECELMLHENMIIRFYGTVVRLEENDLEGKYKYLMGVVYRKIDNKDREALIKFIFAQQVKLRKKGLI